MVGNEPVWIVGITTHPAALLSFNPILFILTSIVPFVVDEFKQYPTTTTSCGL